MPVLNTFLVAVNNVFWSYFLIPLLVLLAVYFTVRSGVVQLRLLPEMFRVLRSSPGTAPDGGREISSFQAFAISAASRVGTGNIVGVATAVMLGGPGAVFWMWAMSCVLGAAAFVESTLAQLYKVRTPTGFRGGPAYYIRYGLENRWMSVLFAVVITVTFSLVFNTVQSNSIAGAVSTSVRDLGLPAGWVLDVVVGLGLAGLTAAVIFGGVRRIATVAQALVPLMAILYILLGLAVVALNIGELPRVVGDIFAGAFGLREFVAGGAGAAILQGMRRGMFSNEAGLGSAPNAGATASVSHPAKQGLVQTLGVYFDTWLVCSVTAFIILVYGPDFATETGAEVTQRALESTLGGWSLHALTVILFLLAFTSVLGNYYYGETNLGFLDADPKHMTYFRYAVLAAVFLGAVAPLTVVWNLADIAMGVMATVNLLALAPLSAIAFRLLADYSRQLRNGLDPQFTLSKMPDLRGVQCWGEPGGALPEDVDRSQGQAPADPAEALAEHDETPEEGPGDDERRGD
ncbi:alanine/glycine:cation symporter family protein [Nocardiopsis changdeensis]|uniref:Alanine:cation symporter family protein n=1 Tax=Nocardiopsis changdeensis TaxID=2831969 RepID=A0ABX8BSZ3_9ACTN|nr:MULTISPECIES: alanine/glycine:cation symporter family protein [Nocardiopsis]QUX24820.1 alanine:cation symporter family protein [Nocardiopsis changdeensis]QYX35206.1 alanine:cation symporter family protein [Nocardiopsis sp. MT53]